MGSTCAAQVLTMPKPPWPRIVNHRCSSSEQLPSSCDCWFVSGASMRRLADGGPWRKVIGDRGEVMGPKANRDPRPDRVSVGIEALVPRRPWALHRIPPDSVLGEHGTRGAPGGGETTP